jgi:hypothetical protein
MIVRWEAVKMRLRLCFFHPHDLLAKHANNLNLDFTRWHT